MGKRILFWICVIFIAVTGGGGCNIFTDMSDKTSDTVIEDDARNLMDHGLWNDAILKLGTLSAAGQQLPSNILLLATAYAGRGGLDIVNLANNLNGASGTFFTLLMTAFKGSNGNNFNDMVTAESLMQSISARASGRTADENLFMLFVEFGKLGTLMAWHADTNADGVLDPAFNNCTGFSALESSHIATAIGNIVDSLAYVNNAIGNSVTSQLTTFCSSYNGACAVYDVNSVSALQQQTARTLAGENHLGVGLAVQLAAIKDKCEFTAPQGSCNGQGALVFLCN